MFGHCYDNAGDTAMRIKLEAIRVAAGNRPEGYYEDVVSKGEIQGEDLVITGSELRKLKDKYDPTWRKAATLTVNVPGRPSILDMSAGLVATLAGWAAKGFPIRSREEIDAIAMQCLACNHWDRKALGGNGNCSICRCSELKWWLATSRCPIDKWRSTTGK